MPPRTSSRIGRPSTADLQQGQSTAGNTAPEQLRLPPRTAKSNAQQRAQEAQATKKRKQTEPPSVSVPAPAAKKNRKSVVPAQKPLPARKSRGKSTASNTTLKRPAAVDIDVDKSDDEPPQPPPKKPILKKNQPSKTPLQRMNAQLENEEDDEHSASASGTDEMELEDDREYDRDAARYLEDESPQFTHNADASDILDITEDNDKNWGQASHRRSSSRASAVSSVLGSTPPPTDPPTDTDGYRSDLNNDDQNEDEEDIDKPVALPTRKLSNKQAKQLEYEFPQISNKKPSVSRIAATANTNTPPPPAPATPKPMLTSTSQPPLWMERTNIVVVGKNRSWKLGMTGQPQTMQKVMDRAIKIGKLKMLTDHQFCPLGEGLKNVALAALISAASEFGYDGENDVAHHLENGDPDSYIKPLIAYVSQRIGAERAKELRDAPSSVVESAYGINTENGPTSRELQNIVLHRNFMYGLDSNGAFDDRKPFQHPAYAKYMHAAMFGANMYSRMIIGKNQQDIFRSSDSSKPLELEVTKGMIHSILQQASFGTSSNFPSKEHASVWETALMILENLEAVNPAVYHTLMHNLYLKSSGAAPVARHGLTTRQVFDLVDWAGLASAKVDEVTGEIVIASNSEEAAQGDAAAAANTASAST